MKSLIVLLVALPLSANVYAATQTKIDSDMKKVLDALSAKKPMAIENLSADEARKQPTTSDAVKDVLTKENGSFIPTPIAKVEDRQIDGAAGKITARIYTPEGPTPMPVIVYYHGGGFVLATNDTYDASPRALANGAKAIVVSVEYRKAPEHKFPAAHDDAFAAYKWVLANAKSFNGDPNLVAVAGESAGGNLALNVAIRARDEKIMLPIHEVLIYPLAGTNMNTESYRVNADAKPLNKAMMGWFMKNYTKTSAETMDVRLNLLSANLRGLNPATIITAQIDPLMTEGQKLADRLKAQGVLVEYKNYQGVTHEFFGMAPVVSEAKDAQGFVSKGLMMSFKKQAQEE